MNFKEWIESVEGTIDTTGELFIPMDTDKGQAIKHDESKNRLELIPTSALIEWGKVMTHGAKKYGPDNWRSGLAWSRTYGALLRHITAWFNGETNDPETGHSHLAHAMCNLGFLVEFATTHPELDDRPHQPHISNKSRGAH